MTAPIKRAGRKPSDPNTHYIDNKELNKQIIEYCNKVKSAKADGTPVPRVPEYLGRCFILLAENIANKSNFRNYPFLNDMISDGIENCLSAVTNFDPGKSTNPFGYFSIIVHRAYIRRISSEKTTLYRKFKIQSNALNYHETYTMGIDGESIDISQSDMEYINAFIKDFEVKQAEAKLKKKLAAEGLQEGDEVDADDEEDELE